MKIKTLTWKNGPNVLTDIDKPVDFIYGDGIDGTIKNSRVIYFHVRKEGKRNPKYILLSYPIESPAFVKANMSKKLGVFSTPNKAMQKAQNLLNEFVNTFIK